MIIYKRYRTRKKGGQRYYINRRSPWETYEPGKQKFVKRNINDIDEEMDLRYEFVTSPEFVMMSDKAKAKALLEFENRIMPEGKAKSRLKDEYFRMFGEEPSNKPVRRPIILKMEDGRNPAFTEAITGDVRKDSLSEASSIRRNINRRKFKRRY